jgi:hypothetical protein
MWGIISAMRVVSPFFLVVSSLFLGWSFSSVPFLSFVFFRCGFSSYLRTVLFVAVEDTRDRLYLVVLAPEISSS